MTSNASAGVNTSNAVVLVEKHYIPIDLYQQIYGGGQRGSTNIPTAQPYTFGTYSVAGSTTGSTPNRPARAARGSSSNSNNLFQTVMENFFPRSSQSSNVSATQTTNSANTNNPDSTPTSTGNGTRRVLVSDVYLDLNGSGGSNDDGLLLFNTLFRAAMGNAAEQGSSSRGLTASEISRNSETYEIDGDQQPYITRGGAQTCSICASEYELGDDIRRLNRCRHEFHETCIDTWLSRHNSCPVCRSAVIANIDNID